ncbi:c-type cytochrome biogenesis protein CcmI, partial [Oleiphilus sp. HI0066]|uniref:c-type cytochrome biogenesis protein CcmI n=2 Tax=Oleiphilus TaxID=141450 RepID=UPI000837C8DA
MTQFWIIASILSLVAVWIVLHPWFKRHKLEEIAVDTAAEARVRANVRAYKERLRELNAELRSDAIDQVQFEEIKKELEATLLGDAKNVQAR